MFKPTTEMIVRITGPNFVAGVVLVNDYVTWTAPILHYMRGWDRNRVRKFCLDKGWKTVRASEQTLYTREAAE
jgi:hypothetical protein